MRRDPAPARRAEAMFTPKNGQKSVLGLYTGKSSLMESLKAKLNAWVGSNGRYSPCCRARRSRRPAPRRRG